MLNRKAFWNKIILSGRVVLICRNGLRKKESWDEGGGGIKEDLNKVEIDEGGLNNLISGV